MKIATAILNGLLSTLIACPASAASAERGKELFAMAAGCGCHTPKDGPIGAGGGEVPTPFGTFYGPNISPDLETGIGRWTDDQIGAAIRDGWTRDGSAESPAMPYYRYAGMADTDVADLIAYVRALAPVRRPSRAAQGELPLARWAYRGWRLLFFRSPTRRRTAPAGGVERGHYLVDHIAICGDCHTPRTRFGAPNAAMYLAGTAHGPDGDPVPNITPDKTGIAVWDVQDIFNVLTMGMLPDFDNVQGLMADMVDGHGGGPGFKDAPPGDLRAIAEYLKTVPAIDNKVEAK